jgi:endonuclease/exonuclease/phosphatase family metal-dependent hydrolase
MNRLLFLALIIVLIAPAWAQPALNVATWNLRLNLASDGPNAWPQRREMAKALIRFHEFDLFGTQEGLIGQIEDLEAMEGYGRVGVGRDDGARAGEHSAIFYRKDRLQLESHGDFWFSATPPYGPVGTFNDFKPELPALDRIDYVFVGPRIRVQRYGVLTDSIAGRVPSDHFPLLTRLAFE